MPIYPDVPDVPGVPPLLRNPLIPSIVPIPPLIADGLDVLSSSLSNGQWGIFLDGENVVAADNVVSFGYSQKWSLSTYTVEQGGFETYDKVNNPFSIRLRFSCGGSESRRQSFIESIDAIAGTTDLYDVVTPEKTWQNLNIEGYDIIERRSDQGVGLIVIDVQALEIRQTGTSAFISTTTTPLTATKTPGGASTVNGGTVQPAALDPSQLAALGGFG
jgi:hypothetical protein